jgi:hypothetical protein
MEPAFNQWSIDKAQVLAELYAQAFQNLAEQIQNRLTVIEHGADLSAFETARLKALQRHIKKEIERLTSQITALVPPLLDEVHELTLDEIRMQAAEPSFSMFQGATAAEYFKQGTLLEEYITTTLKNYSQELLQQVKSTLHLAEIQRTPVNQTSAKIRQMFGQAGQPMGNRLGLYGSSGAAAKASRLVITESARARALGHAHFIKNTPEITGVIIRHGAGPCPSKICPKRAGEYRGRDRAIKEVLKLPRHPWCRCYVQYIYQDIDWARLNAMAGLEN